MATLPAGYIPQRKVPMASSNGNLDFIVKCYRIVDSVFVIAYPMRLKDSLVLLFPFWFNHLRVGMGNF